MLAIAEIIPFSREIDASSKGRGTTQETECASTVGIFDQFPFIHREPTMVVSYSNWDCPPKDAANVINSSMYRL